MKKQSGTLWLTGLQIHKQRIDSIRCTACPSHRLPDKGNLPYFCPGFSVGSSNFWNVRNFISNLVSQLEIGPDNTQVGLINFVSSARIEFHLNPHQDSSSLFQAIANVSYTAGGNTAAALTTLLSEFSTVNGARPLQEGIPRVATVVTDGQSNSPTATVTAASNVYASNIIVYAVGVGIVIFVLLNSMLLHLILTASLFVFFLPSTSMKHMYICSILFMMLCSFSMLI